MSHRIRRACAVTATLCAALSLALLPTAANATDGTTWVQRNLAGLGYLPASAVDGQNGPQTKTAVRHFQADNGLGEDGSYGAQTEWALHNKVMEVQRKAGVAADGAFGDGTAGAVRTWQQAHSLGNDGVAGPATMDAMHVARTVKTTARWKLAEHGWDVNSQFSCLDSMWTRESDWKVHATNPSSGAYGIPQSLPGTKMGTSGSDWQNNPATQIQWGLDYIKSRYSTPCGAWSFWQAHHWY